MLHTHHPLELELDLLGVGSLFMVFLILALLGILACSATLGTC